MSPHRWFIGFICLTWIWAGCANSAFAQTTERRDPKERAIDYRLRQPISLNMKDVPLRQALKDIASISGVQIVPDTVNLEAAGVNMNAPLSIKVEDIDMKFALNILLRPLGLTHVIEDQVLKITTEEKSRPCVRKMYKINDLLANMAMVPAIEGQTKDACFSLIELIKNTVAKDKWEDNAGSGSIQYFPLEKKLVVNQPNEVHEEIALLLAGLRRLYDVTVNVEMRFVHAPTDAAQQWRKVMAQAGQNVDVFQFEDRNKLDQFVGRMGLFVVLDSPAPAKGVRAFVSVNDEQIQPLLEAARTDYRCAIVQASKLTAYNGQTLSFKCYHQRASVTEVRAPTQESDAKEKAIVLSNGEKIVSGWRCSVQPVVSPDRRFVRLNLNVEHFAKDEAKSVEQIIRAVKTFNVADARTLVWDLGATAQRQHLFVLVTPRVVVREAPEAIVIDDAPVVPGR